MKLWKPNYGEEYYYVVVHNVTWSYFSGIGTRTSLSNDNIQVFPRTWLASDEDFQNLLSLNVFKTLKALRLRMKVLDVLGIFLGTYGNLTVGQNVSSNTETCAPT